MLPPCVSGGDFVRGGRACGPFLNLQLHRRSEQSGNVLWLRTGFRKPKGEETYVVTGNGGKPTELGFTLTPQRSSACPSRPMTRKLGLLLEAHRPQLRVERFAWQWRLQSLDG